MDSVTGTLIRGYDGLDRMTSETTPQGGVTYAYDAGSRRTSMTVAGQTAIGYSYDNASRLTGITQGTSAVSFAYDAANRRTSLTLPNGIVMSYSFDAGSQLTGIGYQLGQTNLGNLTYTYDPAGRRTSMGGSLATVNLPNAISTTAYNANNQVTQWGTATPTYDADGNTLSDGTNTYVWNARNQLGSMNLTGESFQYDSFGRRAAKTVLGTTTNYLYDGANPVQELSGTTPTANMLTGGVDEYFTRTDSTGTANFLTDTLGSTLSLTNSSGGTFASYTYEPFGNTTTTAGSSTNTYQYTGRENDGTGVFFYRGRYYSPTLQRFISEDPTGMAGGINLYVYVGNNPISYRDPFGHDKGAQRHLPRGWHQCGDFVCDASGHHMYPNPIGLQPDFIFPTVLTLGLNAGASALQVGADVALDTATPVIGRLTGTAAFAGQDGFEIVNSVGWSSEANAAWIQANIDAGNSFLLASSITEANILSTTNATGFTVFADEISQILGAGYQWVGNYLVPGP